jgi:predicted PurR-regulated permease PerM
MQNQTRRHDLPRTTLGVLVLLGLMGAAIWIMRPFLPALLWATMIVVATWPTLEGLQGRLWGKRGLAAGVLTLALLLVLIIPLTVAVGALLGNMDSIVAWAKSLRELQLPPPPDWVAGLPMVGKKAAEAWKQMAAEGPEGLPAKIQPYAGKLLEWFAARVGGMAGMVLQFLLTVVIAGILYVHGEKASGAVRRFAYRLAGTRGENAIVLASGAIRGVAMGVVVTALVQTVVAGAGLALCSVPGAMLLSSAILVLCLAQLGPMLVMFPAVVWKFYNGDTLWGGVLLVFALVSVTMDNFLRPILIKKGADLPLLLILAGVLGGMIGFGIMGIFVGPVILAVAYTLLGDWIADKPNEGE